MAATSDTCKNSMKYQNKFYLLILGFMIIGASISFIIIGTLVNDGVVRVRFDPAFVITELDDSAGTPANTSRSNLTRIGVILGDDPESWETEIWNELAANQTLVDAALRDSAYIHASCRVAQDETPSDDPAGLELEPQLPLSPKVPLSQAPEQLFRFKMPRKLRILAAYFTIEYINGINETETRTFYKFWGQEQPRHISHETSYIVFQELNQTNVTASFAQSFNFGDTISTWR